MECRWIIIKYKNKIKIKRNAGQSVYKYIDMLADNYKSIMINWNRSGDEILIYWYQGDWRCKELRWQFWLGGGCRLLFRLWCIFDDES